MIVYLVMHWKQFILKEYIQSLFKLIWLKNHYYLGDFNLM